MLCAVTFVIAGNYARTFQREEKAGLGAVVGNNTTGQLSIY